MIRRLLDKGLNLNIMPRHLDRRNFLTAALAGGAATSLLLSKQWMLQNTILSPRLHKKQSLHIS